MKRWFESLALKRVTWLADAVAGAGTLVYAVLSWQMSRTLTTLILDESMYIVKGYFFAIGRYAPYQDYGPLTNHMPLAFMIPGYIQAWFGPGMDTARVFAFLVGLVMLAGVWLAFKRLGGRWWAALAVWAFALNPAWMEVFSQGLSQGIVNAFIVWAFVLLLSKQPKTWQLAAASALAALSVMTRINMLPIFGLLVLYIFWQHGWKKGLAAALAGLLVCALVLGSFWPGVLKFISGWVPEGLFGFIEPYRSPWSQVHLPEGFSYLPLDWLDHPESEQWNGLYALFEGFKFSFIPFLAVISTLAFWPRRRDWKTEFDFKLSALLVVTWLVMAAMHIWVSLSGTSCHFFCLAGYFTFFDLLALMLLAVALPNWLKRAPRWRQVLVFIFLFLILAGTLYSAGYRPQVLARNWYTLMDTPIPRISGGKIIAGETGPLRSIFESVFGLSYYVLVEGLPKLLYWLLIAVFLFGALPLVFRWLRRLLPKDISFAWFAFALLMALGLALGPTPIFYNETNNLRCEDDVTDSHAAVGEVLAALIPPGSHVYWGVPSNMLLLYLPEIEIYPPQLNTTFNYVLGATPAQSAEIYRFGYWDHHLDAQWAAEADYLLIAGDRLKPWQAQIDSGELIVVKVTAPAETCRGDDTRMILLEHNPEP